MRRKGARKTWQNRALERFFRNGAKRWKRDVDPNAHFILFDTMREMMKDAAEKKALRQTEADTELVEESPPSSDSGPHARYAAREEATQLRDELFRRVASSPLTVDVARLYVTEGHLKPAEVADKLGVAVSRVYESTRRIRETIEEMQAERAQAAQREKEARA